MKFSICFEGETLAEAISKLETFLASLPKEVKSSPIQSKDLAEDDASAKKLKRKGKTKEETAPEPAIVVQEPSLPSPKDDVPPRDKALALLRQVNEQQGIAKAREVLNAFKVERFGELEPTQYADFNMACELALKTTA